MAPVLHRQLERLQVVIDQSQLLSSYIQFMNGRAVERAVILDLTGFGDRIFGKYGYIEFERTGGSDRDNGAIPIHLQGIGDLLIRQKVLGSTYCIFLQTYDIRTGIRNIPYDRIRSIFRMAFITESRDIISQDFQYILFRNIVHSVMEREITGYSPPADQERT